MLLALFWIGVALLWAVALLWLAWPLLSRARAAHDGDDRDDAGATVLSAQLEELRRDVESGLLDSSDYESVRRDLERANEDDVEERGVGDGAGASGFGGSSVGGDVGGSSGGVGGSSVGGSGAGGIAKDHAASDWRWRRAGAALLSLFVVGASAGLYLHWSSGYPQGVAGPPPQQQFEQMVERLAGELGDAPEDAAGWVLLAESSKMLGEYAQAANAYREAAKHIELDDWLKVDYAEALFLDAGGRFSDDTVALLEQALVTDPDNEKGLWLLGMANFQAEDYAEAIRHWSRLQSGIEDNDGVRDAIGEQIAAARSRMEEGAADGAPDAAPAGNARSAPDEGGRRIAVLVSIAPELLERAAPDDTVFVYAKAASGPPMPLAIRRFRAADLPLETYLGREDSMTPAMTLDDFDSLRVIARVSRSGQAAAQAGDFIGESLLAPGAGDAIEVHIGDVVGE